MVNTIAKGIACGVIVAVLRTEPWSMDWWVLIICFNVVAHNLNK